MPYKVEHIDPARTAMIVVDMQNDFVADGSHLQSKQALAMVDRLVEMLDFCRTKGVKVIYTAHVHRSDGSDMGLYDDLFPPIANRNALIAGSTGAQIISRLEPHDGEHVIEKHRYSGFYATDLDLILREWKIDTVAIAGATTENCCHATARDALFRSYKVAFLSDLTGTFDYPDLGQGGFSADDVHRLTLSVLAFSTADVMTSTAFRTLVSSGATVDR
ncbi:isochorismatase family cysteine hydrolase [Amycolatopsis sp. NPDC005232]|uniref:cysteine hydrolase family protein n=1 Tax=Amycolatopsis sp. NPDC005232 TaxID=3157027 RepID=UPI0033B8D166